MAVGRVGGVVTAFDVVEAHTATLVVDISCNALNEAHAQEITDALEALPGVSVRKVSDRTFLLHLGGKLSVESKVSLRNRDDLSRAYTPGVARVCQAIAANPADARRLTIKRNTVAVVTDGSAVLGLGNLGAAAAMPVMEGKAALFKRFAGLDANLTSIAAQTNSAGLSGTLADALVGADVFIGVSAPNLFGADELATMTSDAIVFALANPDPEVDPAVALRHAAVVATGRSDYPNQINNVLAFPGVFRGLLDAQARDITDAMLLAASAAIADVVAEPNPSFIVPSVFDATVAPAVAEAVKQATAKKDVAAV